MIRKAMSENIKAESREILKKKVKNLRTQGIIPGAVYGFKGTFNVQLNNKEFSKLFDEIGHTSVLELTIGDKTHNVFIDEVQMNPATRVYTHVTFKEVNMNVETTAEIPFELTGEELSPAVKDEESIIILSKTFVLLRGLPKDLPPQITIDVSGFHAGDTVVLKDIKLPEGVAAVHEEELEDVVVTTTSAVQAEIIEDVNAAVADAVAVPVAEGAEGEAKTEESGKKE
jgi:large subunit ribosomal protein L25